MRSGPMMPASMPKGLTCSFQAPVSTGRDHCSLKRRPALQTVASRVAASIPGRNRRSQVWGLACHCSAQCASRTVRA